MEFTKVVAERYSCKNFSTRKVEAEKLTEILEAGRLAPTAKNFQEQRIYVLQSEESLAKPGKARQGDALPLWRTYLPCCGLR